MVIAVAVTIISAGAMAAAVAGNGATLSQGIGAVLSSGGLTSSAAATSLGLTAGATIGTATAIGIGVSSAVIGSIASQVVGVATGIQEKFSWKAVALAAIGGGISGGLGAVSQGSGALADALQNSFIRGATSSVLTQGIGKATGLQDSFSWAAVAASAIGSGVTDSVAGGFETSNGTIAQLVSSGAGALANAATRTAIEGGSFGDNLLAAVPDVIGSAIGRGITGGFKSSGGFSAGRAIDSFGSQAEAIPGLLGDVAASGARQARDTLSGVFSSPSKEVNSGASAYYNGCLLYTSPSPRDQRGSRMPSSA